ncbi:hypothetical protein J3F84DRAFT_306907 [Trichoderma pleuroticola]
MYRYRYRSTGAQKQQHDKTSGSRPQETRRCPDGLDQDSPARVAAIGAISGVTWTDPTSRGRVPTCHSKAVSHLAQSQGHGQPAVSRGVLESNRFILAAKLHAIPPLLRPCQPPYFAPAELQKIQTG